MDFETFLKECQWKQRQHKNFSLTQLIMLKKLQGGEKTCSRSASHNFVHFNDWTYLEIKLLKVLLEGIVPFQNLKYLMLLVCSDMYMMYLVVNLAKRKSEGANPLFRPVNCKSAKFSNLFYQPENCKAVNIYHYSANFLCAPVPLSQIFHHWKRGWNSSLKSLAKLMAEFYLV